MSTTERPRTASLARVFVAVLGAAIALTFVTISGATEPLPQGEPAHQAPVLPVAKPRSAPSCPRMNMPYLPARALFERAEGPRQAEAIAVALAFRETMLFLEREKEASVLTPPPVGRRPDFERALPGFSLVLGRLGGTNWGPRERDRTAARVVSAIASNDVRVPWGRDFRGFVDRHRGLFGIRADRRVRVVEDDEERVRLEYPNGALSDGRVVTLETYVGRGTCLRTDIPDGNEIRSNLPLDEAHLSDAPAFSAEEALRRFLDIAPYVSTDSEPPVRLVIATGRTGTSRLVWRVSYHYECVSWFANVGGNIDIWHHVADMDAFSGSLL